MASKARKLSIHLHDQCNLNCKHCYLGPPSKRVNSLSLKQIENALSYYKNEGFNSVSFRGGEAFLSPHLKEAVELAKKIGYEFVNVYSNGSYPQIIDLFTPDEIDHFSFSLDGATAQTNDYIRSPGHFEKCLASIKAAINKGFKVWVGSCITKNNLNEVKDLIFLLDDLGVSRLSFAFTSFIGNVIHNPEIIISPKEWVAKKAEVDQITGLKNLTVSMPDFFTTKEKYQKMVKNGYQCLLKEPELYHANIMANGLIFSCSLITESEEFATHILTEKGVVPQEIWKRLLIERYPDSSCPVQTFLEAKYGELNLDEDLVPVCPYRE